MRSLYWWLYTPWKRLTCRWLRWHRWGMTISHGYATTFCSRCWAFEIERLPDVEL